MTQKTLGNSWVKWILILWTGQHNVVTRKIEFLLVLGIQSGYNLFAIDVISSGKMWKCREVLVKKFLLKAIKD
jgi:hypothetical protein